MADAAQLWKFGNCPLWEKEDSGSPISIPSVTQFLSQELLGVARDQRTERPWTQWHMFLGPQSPRGSTIQVDEDQEEFLIYVGP